MTDATNVSYNDLIGKPFDPDKNNCYDVFREVFKRNGVIFPKTNISVCASKRASNSELEKQTMTDWKKISTPEIPCGILIQSANPAFANHIGAYIGKGRFIHVTMNTAVCIERIQKWKHRIIGYYKYVGDHNKH